MSSIYTSIFTSEEIDSLLSASKKFTNYTQLPNGGNLNNYTSIGCYGAESRAIAASILNKPNGLVGSFTMIVLPLNPVWQEANFIQIIFEGYSNNIYFRKQYGYSGQNRLTDWLVIDCKLSNIARKGTTAQRPVIADRTGIENKAVHIGFCYIDETLNKPIFYTGDTSNGKSGWVDATGANV